MKQRVVLFLCLLAMVEFVQAKNYADKVMVYKEKRRLELWCKDSVIFSCSVSLGFNPVGHKTREGDGKTPEGNYILDYRNKYSHFYKSFHVSYPNDSDLYYSKLNHLNPGGLIMIHGLKNGYGWLGKLHLQNDWTNGCIAVTNEEMDIIWDKVRDGTPIEIRK